MYNALRLLLPTLLLLGGSIYWFFSPQDEPQHYEPYEADFNPMRGEGESYGRGIAGAISFYNITRNNLFTGVTTTSDREHAIQDIDQMKAPARAKNDASYQWNWLGPDNVGGRTRDMIIDKDNSDLLVVGSVSGGIYRSTNRGRSWKKTSQPLENNAIVCMEQTGDGTMFFGTGEGNFTYLGNGKSSGVIGDGVWRSDDKGVTWSRVIGPDEFTQNDRWSNTNEMAADPSAQQTLYAATDNGVMVTTNGGESWQEEFVPEEWGAVCLDVDVSSDGKTIYAVFINEVGVETCRIYRSDADIDGGAWKRIGEEDISESLSRIELGIAPSNKDFVYAAAAYNSASDARYRLEGFYQSKDGGDSWRKLIESDPYTFYPFSNFGLAIGGQGYYDNSVNVDPNNPERVYLGGVHFYRWSEENGWFRLAGTQRVRNSSPGNEFYVHADKHNVLFDTTVSPYRLYVLSDGGVTYSDEAENEVKPRFRVLNKNYGSIQFYNVAASTQPPYKVLGGAQDNGTQRIEPNTLSGKSSVEVRGGDGFSVEISRYADRETWFTSVYYGNVERSFEEGEDGSPFFDNNVQPESSSGNLGPFNTTFRLWEGVDTVTVERYEYDPENPENSRIIQEKATNYRSMFVLGTYSGIYATLEATNEQASPTWFRIANAFGQVGAQALDFAFSEDGDHLFVAGVTGSTGEVYRISGLRDARFQYDAEGVFNLREAGISVRRVQRRFGQAATGIDVDDNDPNRVIVSYGNYDERDHVFISENALSDNPTFTSIQNNLPAFPVYDAQISNSDANEIILGTEFGLFTSTDGGDSWVESNQGANRIPVYEIRQYMHKVYEDDKIYLEGPYFYAGSHGRGVFRTQSQNLVLSEQEVIEDDAAQPLALRVYPNPAQNQIRLGWEAQQPASPVQLSVYNQAGQQVRRLKRNAAELQDMELDISQLEPGGYIIHLQQGEETHSGRFIKR